jgi:agmatine/peptidylarginine deiminase
MIRSDFDKVNHLILPYPRGFDNEYEKLVRFFEDLISIVPADIHQYIIVNNKAAGEIIKLMNPAKNIDTILIDGFDEIWLRDIIGFAKGNEIIKPIFKPTYYRNVYTDKFLTELDRQVGEIIQQITGKEPVNMPLVLDGGNLITNGEVGIITDKCIRDNTDNSIEEINSLIYDYLNIEPIFIETPKNDLLAHSDGYVSFIDKKNILVSSYPDKPFLESDKKCVEKIVNTLQEKKFNIHRILDRPIDEKAQSIYNMKNDYLLSARGNYVNFLNLNNTIILPQYNLTSIKESNYYNKNNARFFIDKKYSVNGLNCDFISKHGGVLRCLSFVF